MTKRQTTIIIVFGVVVLAGIVIGVFFRGGSQSPASPMSGESPAATSSVGQTATSPNSNGFSGSVPANAVPTTPAITAPASQNSGTSLNIFNLQISSAGFNPTSITVKMGSLVKINLTAVGGDYDWSMPYAGLYVSVKKGETKQIGWGATNSGTFTFGCRDLCPAGRTISGELIVIP